MKPFNLVILVTFLVLAAAGVAVFATFQATGGASVGAVKIWGTVSKDTMDEFLKSLKSITGNDFDKVTYTEFSKNTLMPMLVEAIAKGAPPDAVLFPSEHLVLHADKILTIPYNTFSRREFQDTFVEAGEVFLTADGFKGYPFIVDPLVMYWNRSLFSASGVARPPKYWDDLSSAVPLLTEKDERGGVTQSAVALGAWENVAHAKAIFLSILYQLGNPVIVRTDTGIKSIFSSPSNNALGSAESALRFYTEFADPVKPSYTWNRSRANSRAAFLSGTVAIYFGRTSELTSLRAENPNLNFDVAPVPATRGASGTVEASMIAFAVPRGSKNAKDAFSVAEVFSGASGQKILASVSTTPSVRRDTLSVSPGNPYAQIFNNAALSSFAFLDPNPIESNSIFGRMIERVLSGELRIQETVLSAGAEFETLIH